MELEQVKGWCTKAIRTGGTGAGAVQTAHNGVA